MQALSQLDVRLSSGIHGLRLGVGDYAMCVPAFVFSSTGVPILLLVLYGLLPLRSWAGLLLAWYVDSRSAPGPSLLCARDRSLTGPLSLLLSLRGAVL